jgi:hypothetical protein
MKCSCGYEGPGDIVDENKSDAVYFLECPKCKSSKFGIRYMTGIDIVRKAILEDNATVTFTQGSIFKSHDGKTGLDYTIEYRYHDRNQQNRYEYGWISLEEYRWLKKWVFEKNMFDKYCEEFAMTDCTICSKEIDFKCRFIAKRVVGECKGKIHETMAEANWPDANRYEGLYKYYYRRIEEV